MMMERTLGKMLNIYYSCYDGHTLTTKIERNFPYFGVVRLWVAEPNRDQDIFPQTSKTYEISLKQCDNQVKNLFISA